MEFKERIKAKRIENGFTLEELAQKVGVSRQTIQRYESGVISNVPSDKIELLAKSLDTTPAYLMGWEEDSDKYTDDELHGINGMTSILQYLYDTVEFKEYIMCETFDVVLKKNNLEVTLNEDEYNLLFDFVCSNISNYINLVKGQSALATKKLKNVSHQNSFNNIQKGGILQTSHKHLNIKHNDDKSSGDSSCCTIAPKVFFTDASEAKKFLQSRKHLAAWKNGDLSNEDIIDMANGIILNSKD